MSPKVFCALIAVFHLAIIGTVLGLAHLPRATAAQTEARR